MRYIGKGIEMGTKTADYRIVVSLDEDSGECPLEWSGDAALGYGFGWYNRQREFGNEELREDMAEFVRMVGDYLDSENAILGALERHYARQGYDVERRNWVGYSQGDYMEYVAISGNGDLACSAFESWLRGDVYNVDLERSVTWTSDDGRTMCEWETVENVGGCYLDKIEAEARETASECFGIDNTEQLEVIRND